MNLKEIKDRIKAVQKTGSITKAMQNIALSKLKNSNEIYDHSKLYFDKAKNITKILFNNLDEESIFFRGRNNKKKLYILISSDRGLAGPYHSHLFSLIKDMKLDSSDILFLPIGKKGFQFIEAKKFKNSIKIPYLNRDDIMTFDYSSICKLIVDIYKEGNIDSVVFLYNKYKSITEHESVSKVVLPISFHERNDSSEYIFENKPQDMIDDVIKIYIYGEILKALANAKVSEHSSRMIAMKNATDNAEEIASKLKISYHRVRQKEITEELIDVINGSKS
jgi:F-type H+-transporting ATPase subunit gamma